jgi:hypothetical protein
MGGSPDAVCRVEERPGLWPRSRSPTPLLDEFRRLADRHERGFMAERAHDIATPDFVGGSGISRLLPSRCETTSMAAKSAVAQLPRTTIGWRCW